MAGTEAGEQRQGLLAKNLWVDYRTTAEQIKSEKYLFLTGSGPYIASDSFPLFVTRVESIIARENRGW